jgi:hypothetical protein
MGFFSKIFDDVLGLDPGGGGIYNVARDVLGDKIADDVLGMDPGGGGFIKEYNVLLPMIAGYYGLEALGGTEGIANMFGSGSGAAGTTFTEAQLAAASASADPIAYLASATPGAAVGAGEALAAGTLSGGGGAAGGAGAAGAGTYSGSIMNTLSKYATPISMGVNALTGAYASNKAAGVQSDAARYAADLQNQQFERQLQLQAPFREAGVRALPELEAASRYTPFGMEQFQADPGYAFRMSEGMKGLERSAAARGGLLSGATLKGIQRFGQDLGSQEYTNAFNRYQTERNARLNPLQSLAGIGQTSTTQLGAAGQTMASNVGQAMGASAQARASGYMGGANALSGALGQYMNYNQQQQQNEMFNRLLSQRDGGMGYTSEEGFTNTPSYMVR